MLFSQRYEIEKGFLNPKPPLFYRKLKYNGVYLINADGTGLRQLTNFGGEAGISPEGDRVAFQSKGSLFVIGTDGKDLHQVPLPAGISARYVDFGG